MGLPNTLDLGRPSKNAAKLYVCFVFAAAKCVESAGETAGVRLMSGQHE